MKSIWLSVLNGVCGSLLILLLQLSYAAYMQQDCSFLEMNQVRFAIDGDDVIRRRFLLLTEDRHLSKADLAELRLLQERMRAPVWIPPQSLSDMRSQEAQNMKSGNE